MNCQDRAFILYSQIVGIQHHPRAMEKVAAGELQRLPPRQAVGRTLEYMDAFRETFGRCGDERCRFCSTE